MKSMIYTERDLKSGKEYKNDLRTLKTISLPKDTLILACELLTPDQLGRVMMDVVNDLFGNEDCPIRDKTNNAENVVYERFVENIGRLSASYFKKIKNLNNSQAKKEKESVEPDTENNNYYETPF